MPSGNVWVLRGHRHQRLSSMQTTKWTRASKKKNPPSVSGLATVERRLHKASCKEYHGGDPKIETTLAPLAQAVVHGLHCVARRGYKVDVLGQVSMSVPAVVWLRGARMAAGQIACAIWRQLLIFLVWGDSLITGSIDVFAFRHKEMQKSSKKMLSSKPSLFVSRRYALV
jgi:hypothetical protein